MHAKRFSFNNHSSFNKLKPFKGADANVLGVILSYSLLMFFVAAVMIQADMTGDDKGDQQMFGILLIFLLIGGPLILTTITIKDITIAIYNRAFKKKKPEAIPSEVASSAGDEPVEAPPSGIKTKGTKKPRQMKAEATL